MTNWHPQRQSFKPAAVVACLFGWLAVQVHAQLPEGASGQEPDQLPHPEIALPSSDLPSIPGWVVLMALLAIVGAVTGVLALLFGRQTKPPPIPRRTVKDTVRALKALRNTAEALGPAAVAHQVSNILRRFHEERYGIPAPRRTSQELFPSMDLSAESARRRAWRERYEPLAAMYDSLSYAPVPASTAEAVRLIDAALEKLEEERLNE